jgi:MoaA/NifB/PqqE/SkfB family radical SAM enzyme
MGDGIFNKIIADLKEFDSPLKLVYFSLIGEPLLNKKLPNMINRFHSEKLTARTVLFTNAVSLSKDMSQSIVDAGLTRIKISVNGLSSEDYLRNCGVAINFDRFVEQIAYLYDIKKSLIIQIKTIDKLLTPGNEERFYSLFGNICNQITIEKMFPIFKNVPYDKLFFRDEDTPISRFESARKDVEICAQPFYRMAVAANGTVCLCYTDITDGSIFEKSLKDIWNGGKRKNLLTNLLQMKCEGITEECGTCACGHEQADENDNLYPYRDEILHRLCN